MHPTLVVVGQEAGQSLLPVLRAGEPATLVALGVHGAMETLDLSVRLRAVGPSSLVLDFQDTAIPLEQAGDELLAVVREHGADGRGGPPGDLVEEVDRILGGLAGVDSGEDFARPVIDGRELILPPLLSLDGRQVLHVEMNQFPWLLRGFDSNGRVAG